VTLDEEVDRAAEQSKDTGGHRRIWWSFAIMLFGALLLSAMWFTDHATLAGQRQQLADVGQELADQHQATNTLIVQANQLADQVRHLGGTPVVAPPATAPVGQAGTNGHDGQTPPCLFTASQCVGAPGQPGTNGANGTNGVDGQTPPCMSTPAQCQGADGKNGTDGKNGSDGKDGATGPAGTSVTRQYFARNAAGECHSYNDFSDGRTVDEGPAGDAACPAPSSPPPTQTTPAVLPPSVTKRRRD
jgi:hypothetical protein